MFGIVQQLTVPAVSPVSLNFGVRAAAIVVVVVACLMLGNWARGVISRIPVRSAGASERGTRLGQRVVMIHTVSSRALGWLAYACVLLAGLAAVAAIINYGQPGAGSIDFALVLRTYESLAQRIIGVLLLFPATLAVASFLQRATIRALQHARIGSLRGRVDTSLQVLAGRLVYVSILILGGFVILYVLGVPIAVPAVLVGVVTLALSLALQDVLRNLFAGVYLLVERPFVIGDEITVTSFTGQVEDIHLRITSLRARDGQRVLVPNSILFTSTVVNATAQDRRPATLTLTLSSAESGDFGQLEERILSTILRVQDVCSEPSPSVVLNRASQGKLDVRVEFWVRGTEDTAQGAISEAITQLAGAFSEVDVGVAPAAAPAG